MANHLKMAKRATESPAPSAIESELMISEPIRAGRGVPIRAGRGVLIRAGRGVGRACLLATTLLASLSAAWPAAADDPSGLATAAAIENTFIKAIEQAEPSVVSIARDKPGRRLVKDDDLFRHADPELPTIDSPEYIPTEFGAGVIVRDDGLILTNYHLVRGAAIDGKTAPSDQVLYVRLFDRRGFHARIFAADPRSDLAILKIEAPRLKPIKFGNATNLRKGQLVLGLGNPYAIARDGSPSASWGMISNISRYAGAEPGARDEESLKNESVHHLGTLLQVDTRLNLGTSGGALLNLRGEMIGLTTSLAAIVGYEKSAGFAVPCDEAFMRVIKTLMEGYEVEYGFLGVTPRDLDGDKIRSLADRIGQYGAARVATVIPNSPAAQGRMRPDDIVVSVNGRPVLSRSDLMREVGLLAPGAKARIVVWREAEAAELALTVIVGKWPVKDDEGIVASRRRNAAWRGLVVDFSTARFRFLPTHNLNPTLVASVLALEVEPQGAAAEAGLQPGDFITRVGDTPVQTPQQFYDAVKKLTGPVKLSVAVLSPPLMAFPGEKEIVVKAP